MRQHAAAFAARLLADILREGGTWTGNLDPPPICIKDFISKSLFTIDNKASTFATIPSNLVTVDKFFSELSTNRFIPLMPTLFPFTSS